MPTTSGHDPVIMPLPGSGLPAEIGHLLPDEVRLRWQGTDRTGQNPRLVGLRDAHGAWTSVALVTARPGTAYLKIVDALGDRDALTGHIADIARAEGAVKVAWEIWDQATPVSAPGFVPLAPPVLPDPTHPESVLVRWLTTAAVTDGAYYRQTTAFSCGAAAALSGLSRIGVINPADRNPRRELTLWQEATNFLACDPVRLGLALRRRWPASHPAVALDARGPVMIEGYPEGDREWRALLQEVSRDEAQAEGLPRDDSHWSMTEVRRAVEEGKAVLLLLSLRTILGVDAPHWVLCHSAVGGALVIEDSWVNTAAGEFWADGHLLPVADAQLDEMSLMERDGYRALVTLGDGFGTLPQETSV